MTNTDKRKAQLREAQTKLRAKKTSKGWKRIWIPPELIERVKKMINGDI